METNFGQMGVLSSKISTHNRDVPIWDLWIRELPPLELTAGGGIFYAMI